MSTDKYVVWRRSFLNGETGHGSPMERKEALAMATYSNRVRQDFFYWIKTVKEEIIDIGSDLEEHF